MAWLVLGATGLLGQHVMQALDARGIPAIGAARSGADEIVDITRPIELNTLLLRVNPGVVINCAAMTSLAQCEENPKLAYKTNARPIGVMAAWSQVSKRPFVQVSTDHYFHDGLRRHNEGAEVTLRNAYAASKMAAELLAITSKNSLILRTNFCGVSKGFGRWMFDTLKVGEPFRVFSDHYTSTMNVTDCAEGVLDLIETGARGVVNLASRDVSSKAHFILAAAREAGLSASHAVRASAESQEPKRALTCGLDVSRAESLLGRSLPTFEETIVSLVREEKAWHTPHTSTSPVAKSA